MALVAGLVALAVRTWPIAVLQGRGPPGVGCSLQSPSSGPLHRPVFLADRHWRRARSLLVIAGVAHLIIGFASGALVEAQDLAPPPWRCCLISCRRCGPDRCLPHRTASRFVPRLIVVWEQTSVCALMSCGIPDLCSMSVSGGRRVLTRCVGPRECPPTDHQHGAEREEGQIPRHLVGT